MGQFTKIIILLLLAASASRADSPSAAPSGPPPGLSMDPPGATQAGFCPTCQASSQINDGDSIQHVKDQVKGLKQQVSGNNKDNVTPEQQEEMAEHIERTENRMLRQIHSMSCDEMNQQNDDDDSGPGGRGGGGDFSEFGGGMPGQGGGGSGPDMKKIAAQDPSFSDDIQDAMQAKRDRCQREAKTQQKLAMIFGGTKSGCAMNMNSVASMTGVGQSNMCSAGAGAMSSAMPQSLAGGGGATGISGMQSQYSSINPIGSSQSSFYMPTMPYTNTGSSGRLAYPTLDYPSYSFRALLQPRH